VAPTAEPLVFAISVDCSSGTYVRSLAADLGRALGGGAHLRNLRRTAVGSFTLAEARPLTDLQLLPLEAVMRDYPAVVVDADGAVAVGHGKRLPADLTGPAALHGPVAVLGPDGALLAVSERRGAVLAPMVVLATS
jgi:tRNA pseudouridine55 synthase